MSNCDKVSTYFKEFKVSFILATISGLIYNSLMAFIPIMQGKLINNYILNKDVKELYIGCLLFILLVIFIQINRYIKRYFVRDFSNRMVLAMRTKTYENLILSDISNFVSANRGDILNKNLSDIKDSAEGVRKILTEVYDSFVLLAAYTISLLIMDYKTTLMLVVFVILSILTAKFMKKIIMKNVKEYKEETSKNKELTLNVLKNEVYYRGFGVSNNYLELYKEEQEKMYKKGVKATLFSSSFEPIYELVALLGLVIVIYFTGCHVLDNVWLVGTFSSYLSTYVLVARKASKTGKIFNASAKFKVSWARVKPYLKDVEIPQKLEISSNDINLKVSNLQFGFDNTFEIKNISFELNKGEILGVCGAVHSGKSTLLAALSGLYDYSGSIKLLGYELKDVKNSIIDNYISYISAQNELFTDSIDYNVTFNDFDCSKYLEKVKLDKELDKNMVISHSTTNISGGQIKRLLIARTLFNNAYLTLLDDPFNAIDNDLAMDIFKEIKETFKDKMVIIVTKEKEILKECDKILFLSDNDYTLSNYNNLLGKLEFKKIVGD